jgi:glycosyltransferase involved in cell wall biosynthesis
LLSRRLDAFAPDAVHIATEGPLGSAARRWCKRRGMGFTTSYHTRFPEYLRARMPIPVSLSYAYLRRFHSCATRTMVATQAMQVQLENRGFRNIVRWTRGVDVELFQPRPQRLLHLPQPICMYVGRVAVEKNVEAFLALDLPGTKVVVGDGPARAELQRKYPATVFAGFQRDETLARHVASADVFVFPSRTDTFGLVLLEAMASGVPVAAYPVTGPIDVVRQGVTGMLDEDLAAAARAALLLDRGDCRNYALQHTWQAATQQFLANLCITRVAAAVASTKKQQPVDRRRLDQRI